MERKFDEFKQQEKIICVLSLLAMNIIPNFIQIPLSIQIFVNAVACVVLGCIIGVRFKERTGQIEQDLDNQQEKLKSEDAYMFPVYGSATLFGLYLLIKYINKDLLEYLLQGYFSIIGLACLMQIINNFQFKPLQALKKIKIIQKKMTINFIKENNMEINISVNDIVTGLISSIPTAFYLYTNHWNLNNLFGLSFTLTAIDSISLPNFKVGFILLWGLFFYDIFWVYGTDVMVTVAKNLNAPIKLLFPIDLLADPPKLSLLGLGDLGIFVALCLKLDIDQFLQQKKDKLQTPYFNACAIGYALGIIATYATMIIFNHGQPALLFLVPGCCGSVLYMAWKKNEIKEVYNYEDTPINNVENKDKSQ